MANDGTIPIGVECYAGHRGEQTPRSLIIAGERIDVAQVLDQWLAPDHRYFKLKGTDHHVYLIRHDTIAHTWELTLYQR